jgi:hypothetical protein
VHHDVGLRPGERERPPTQKLPFIVAGRGGGAINTGRLLPDTSGNQGDLLTTLLACAGIPLDRPIGIADRIAFSGEIRRRKATGMAGRANFFDWQPRSQSRHRPTAMNMPAGARSMNPSPCKIARSKTAKIQIPAIAAITPSAR